MAALTHRKGTCTKATEKLQLVAKDHGKRATSLAYDVLCNSEPATPLDAYVSLDWSEGSTPGSCGRNSSSDQGTFPEATASEFEIRAARGGSNSDASPRLSLKAWMGKCMGLINKVVFAESVGYARSSVSQRWNVWRRALVVFLCGVFLSYIASGFTPVQNAARMSGALDCLVVATKHTGIIGRIIVLHLIQNLIRNNGKNAERVIDRGLDESLREILKSEGHLMIEELKVTASYTVSRLAVEIPSRGEALVVPDTIRAVVEILRNSRSSREKVTALRTLAILMTIPEGNIASSIVNANGEDLLVDIMGNGTTTEVMAAAWALGNLWGSQVNCNMVHQKNAISTLTSLLNSGENNLGTHSALIALGNLMIWCPKFKMATEAAALMDALVRLLADTLDPRWSSWKVQVTDVAAQKISKIRTTILAADMNPGALDELFTTEAPRLSNAPSDILTNPETLDTVQTPYREPGTILNNLLVLIGVIDDLIGRPAAQEFWFVEGGVFQLKNHAVRLKYTHGLSQNKLAARASWAIGNLVARNMHQQKAIRQMGGIEILVKVLDSALVNPKGGQYAALTLANIVANSPENKYVMAQTSGVEVLMHLIGFKDNEDLAMSALACLKAIAWGVNESVHQ